MKKLLLTATLASLTVTIVAPIHAAPLTALSSFEQGQDASFDRHGRRPRVPGGSGCDTPRDIREHPECTPA